jgi:hypothetical protein
MYLSSKVIYLMFIIFLRMYRLQYQKSPMNLGKMVKLHQLELTQVISVKVA